MKRLLAPILALLAMPCFAGTVSQFSTIDALMQGIYDGPATFTEVGRAGDFGIGTVNNLDGEMLALDGVFYQITSDGKVHVIPDSAKTSFATVTFFKPEHQAAVPAFTNFASLQGWLDQKLGSQNYFWAVRLHGTFPMIKVRSISRQHPPYLPLAEVAKTESVYEYHDITGTLVGFRSPPYIKGINVPGYHFHFLSDDKNRGGHVLECSVTSGTVTWELLETFQMQLPKEASFRNADFSTHDAKALQSVEQER